MANGLPSFQELLAAQRAAGGIGTGAQEAVQGIREGIDLGSTLLERQRGEEERKRQFQQKVSEALAQQKQKEKEFEANTIPPELSLTGQRATPEVQKTLTPKTPDPLKLDIQKTDEAIIAVDPTTGKEVNRIKLTPKDGGKGGKNEEAAFLAANAADSINTIEKILGITETRKAEGKGRIPFTKRLQLSGLGERGFLQPFGVDPDAAAEVRKQLFNTTVQIVKLYQGSRPSDFDYKAYLEFITPKVATFATGTGEANILKDLKDGLKVMTAVRKGIPINPNDPAYEKYLRLAPTLGVYSKSIDPALEAINQNLDPNAPILTDAILENPNKKGEKSSESPAQPTGKTIRVREKSSGQTGSLPEEEFDPNLYERL